MLRYPFIVSYMYHVLHLFIAFYPFDLKLNDVIWHNFNRELLQKNTNDVSPKILWTLLEFLSFRSDSQQKNKLTMQWKPTFSDFCFLNFKSLWVNQPTKRISVVRSSHFLSFTRAPWSCALRKLPHSVLKNPGWIF